MTPPVNIHPREASDPMTMTTDQRLSQQLTFLLEIEKLKRVLRRSYHLDFSRREDDAEHSWHLAVMALVLREHATGEIDVSHVLRLVLVHDLVEIDAGDAFLYDQTANMAKEARERDAAARVFGLLPDDQAAEMRGWWEEFEACATPEARYANACDRAIPILLHAHSEGLTWREHGITASMVVARNKPIILPVLPALWQRLEGMIAEAVRKGHLEP